MSSKKLIALVAISLPIAGYGICSGMWSGGGGSGNDDWNLSGNWSGCIPMVAGDTATFGVPMGSPASQTVNVNIPVTLSTSPCIIFSSSTTTAYTIIGNNTITFGGAASGISVTGSQTFGNGMGAPNLLQLNGTTVFTINGGGTLNFLNTSLEDIFQSTVNITGGTSITSTNSNNVMSNTTGNAFISGGAFSMNGGTLTNTNSATVANTGGGAIGSFFGGGTVNFSASFTNVTITNTNSGTIGAMSQTNTGVILGIDSGTGSLNFTNCTVTSSNTGPVNNGFGALIQAGSNAGDTVITSSTINLTNSTAFSGTMPSGNVIIGSALISGSFSSGLGDVSLSGGAINLVNSGNITGDNHPDNIFGTGLIGNSLSIDNGGKVYVANASGVTITQPSAGLFNAGSLLGVFNDITVTNGLLVNNDSVGAPDGISVFPAGTLSGTGTFYGSTAPSLGSGTTIVNAGTVLPGNPGVGGTPTVGTTPGGVMTIVGNYVQAPTGVLNISILNTSSFSQLNITDTTPHSGNGGALLSGTVRVAATPGGSFSPADTFNIVLAPGGILGTFDNVVNAGLPPGFSPVISFGGDPTFIILSFTTEVAGTLLKYPNIPGVIISSVNQLNQITEMNMFRRFACKKESTKTPTSTQRHGKQFDVPEWIEERVEKIKGKKADKGECCPQRCESRPWNIYVGPLGVAGGESHTGRDQIGYGYWGAGGLFGFDYTSTNWGIGAVTTYEKVFGHAHEHWGKFTIDDIHTSVYGRFAIGRGERLAFDLIAGGGYEFYHIDRNIDFEPFFKRTSHGRPRGNEFDGLFSAQYTFGGNSWVGESWQVVPQVGVQYIRANLGEYHEHHGEFYDLRFNRQHVQSLRSIFGVRGNNTWIRKKIAFTPEINLAWQREFLYHDRKVDFTAAEFVEPMSHLDLPAAGRNVLMGGFNFFINVCNRYGFEANYNFEWNSQFHDHSFYTALTFRR